MSAEGSESGLDSFIQTHSMAGRMSAQHRRPWEVADRTDGMLKTRGRVDLPGGTEVVT